MDVVSRFRDFVVARRIHRRLRLSDYLRATGAGAGDRSRFGQCLAHGRTRDFDMYCHELEHVLRNAAVHRELKKAAIDFLKHLPHPTAKEWKIIERLVDGGDWTFQGPPPSDVSGEAMMLIAETIEWHRLAVDSGAIDRWSQKFDIADSWFSFLAAIADRKFGAWPR